MTTRRMAGALVAAASAATLAVGAIGAGAQTPPPIISMSFSTEAGPPGSHVTVSGTQCSGGVATVFGRNRPTPDPSNVVTSVTFTPDQAGNWTGDFVIPADIKPNDQFFISGQCTVDKTVITFYDFLPFNVTEPPTPPPTEPAPPADVPPPATPPAGDASGASATPMPQAGSSMAGGVPMAAPATPVPGEPTFTG